MPSLIGTGPNQIPTNNLLGSLAFQDAENARFENISTLDFTSSGNANLTNVSYSGTMTGGTGVINIGAGQIYKDASGNVVIGSLVSTGSKLKVNPDANTGIEILTGNTSTNTRLLFRNAAANTTIPVEYQAAAHYWYTTGSVLTATLSTSGDLLLSGTGATKVQEGTTAQRPASPQEGMIRKNSTLGIIEGYSGGGYVSLEAGRLINVRLFTTHSTHSSFTIDPKTKTMVVELIGGGGGGGQKNAGPYATNLFGSIGQSGGSGTAVKFIIKDPTQSTFYYYIGQGGTIGSNGSSSHFSLTSTAGTLTDYITAPYGLGGGVVNAAALPLVAYGALGNTYLKGGSLTTAAIVAEGGSCVGNPIAILAANSNGVLVSGGQTYGIATPPPVPWSFANTDLISPTTFAFGSGGEGSYGYRNDTTGSYYSMSATNGFQGMLRVYEYS